MDRRHNNPAARLLDLVERARAIDPETECAAAWGGLLDADPSDLAGLTLRIGRAMALVGEIEDAVRSCESIRPETYLCFTVAIGRAFARQRFGERFASFLEGIDKPTLNYLQMTSDLLAHQRPEGTVSEDWARWTEEALRGLLREVSGSKLDPETKEFITRRSDAILEAMKTYRVAGLPGLLEALYAVSGEIRMRPELQKSLEKSYLGKRLFEILDRFRKEALPAGPPNRTG